MPRFVLPDPLLSENGTKISTPSAWHGIRRPEILKMLTHQMFGEMPSKPEYMRFTVTADAKIALDGLAIRKEATIHLKDSDKAEGVDVQLLMYLPAKAKKPVPVFLGLNFAGNHTIQKVRRSPCRNPGCGEIRTKES